jgi:hypothetical protein
MKRAFWKDKLSEKGTTPLAKREKPMPLGKREVAFVTAYVYGVIGKGCSQHKREEVLNVREGDKRVRKNSHRLGFGEGKGEQEGS